MALYVYKDNQQLGPFEEDDVQTAIRNGGFSYKDLASRDGQGSWQPLSFYFPSEAPTNVFSINPDAAAPRPDSPDSEPTLFAKDFPQINFPSDKQARVTDDFTGAPPTQLLDNYAPPVYQPPPVPHQGYPPAAPQYQTPYGTPQRGNASSGMVGFVMGIVTLVLMGVGIIPCLGWVNWFTLLVGTITVILCAVQMNNTPPNSENYNKFRTGLIMAGIAMVIGFFRLLAGGGFF